MADSDSTSDPPKKVRLLKKKLKRKSYFNSRIGKISENSDSDEPQPSTSGLRQTSKQIPSSESSISDDDNHIPSSRSSPSQNSQLSARFPKTEGIVYSNDNFEVKFKNIGFKKYNKSFINTAFTLAKYNSAA